jgi:inner membrane transporter RhtA
MVSSLLLQRRPVIEAAPGAAGRSGRLAGVALMLGSGLSNQIGAATGALAFPVIGPAGVVAVRQWVAGVVLLAIGRPRCGASPGASGGRCCRWPWCSPR